MAVNDGDKANASTFNGGFLSRTNNSGTIARVSLLSPTSGGSILDAQQDINNNTQGVSDNALAISGLDTRVQSLEQNQTPLGNYTAIVDPLATDDTTEGYSAGSEWINQANGRIFRAISVAEGVAVWKRMDRVSLAVKNSLILDFSTDPVDASAWVEISSDIGPDAIKNIQSFYPDGDPAEIGIGGSGSEVRSFILTPGGNGESGIGVDIPSNSRISIRLLSGGTINNAGKLILNLLGES